jgi:hypothetical protein
MVSETHSISNKTKPPTSSTTHDSTSDNKPASFGDAVKKSPRPSTIADTVSADDVMTALKNITQDNGGYSSSYEYHLFLFPRDMTIMYQQLT